MRLFALTFGGTESASTQYRLFQYQDLFRDANIEFEWQEARSFTEFEKLGEYDVVVLQKTLLARNLIAKIREHTAYLIYDTDDRIWLRPNRKYGWLARLRIQSRIKRIAEVADLCTVANQVIASDLVPYHARIEVLPMALDERVWPRVYSAKLRTKARKLTIGWSGSPKNLEFLYDIEPALFAIQQEYAEDVEFLVHCGKSPAFKNLDYEYIRWKPDNEPATIARFDIGLVPLPEDEFARGKSPIKSLQYAASNVAIIATPEGAIMEILENEKSTLYARTQKEWEDALRRLIGDSELRGSLANNAYQTFTEIHSLESVFDQMYKVLSV